MYYLNRFKFIPSFTPLLNNPELLAEYILSINNLIKYIQQEVTKENKYSKRNKELLNEELKEYNKQHNTKYWDYWQYVRSLYLHKQKLLKKVKENSNLTL
jgi:hypothetical protein